MDAEKPLVFVDLDRCLLVDDSISVFLARLIDRGLLPRSVLLRGAIAYFAYRLNLADAEAMIHRGVQHLAGRDESVLREEAEELFQHVIRFRYRPVMLAEIERHRAEGRRIFLLTGGLPYLPACVAADLDLTGALATGPEIRDGRMTGRVLDPPCAGAGKIAHAQRAAEALDTTLEGCWFYTDSYSDLPMLRVAANPVAVNPDGKLKRWARRQRWPIL